MCCVSAYVRVSYIESSAPQIKNHFIHRLVFSLSPAPPPPPTHFLPDHVMSFMSFILPFSSSRLPQHKERERDSALRGDVPVTSPLSSPRRYTQHIYSSTPATTNTPPPAPYTFPSHPRTLHTYSACHNTCLLAICSNFPSLSLFLPFSRCVSVCLSVFELCRKNPLRRKHVERLP